MRREAFVAVWMATVLLALVGAMPANGDTREGGVVAAGGMMGPGGMHHRGMMGRGMMGGNFVRHRYVRRNGLPPQFRDLRNPLPPTPANIAAGEKYYATHCASCHGPRGYGNGPAAAQLNPPPANLARAVRTPIATDPFLYWTIAEGGIPVGSAMPAFQEVLSPTQAWQIILFLRQL